MLQKMLLKTKKNTKKFSYKIKKTLIKSLKKANFLKKRKSNLIHSFKNIYILP